MNLRENILAALNYEPYESLPLLHFGYWKETLEKWYSEGHITREELAWYDGSPVEDSLNKKLGFDANWTARCFGANCFLNPYFERRVLETLPDGHVKVCDGNGLIVLEKPGIVSIPAEVDYLLKDRAIWESDFKHRLQYSDDRINFKALEEIAATPSDKPLGLFLGSLFGNIRNMLSVQGSAYLYADDEDLFLEIIETVGELCYQVTKAILSTGIKFDYGHFWEDICYKNGPLVIPSVFDEMVGPQYKRITDLCKLHGINLFSLDCDGCIDTLIPTWLNNGVNVMFPIEVGTWNASIKPWREKYGNQILGVGGMNKNVFAQDRAAVDAEIMRLKELVSLGGFIPCPDHRIPPTADWNLVLYYTSQFRRVFD